MKNSVVTHLHLNSDFDSLTPFQLEGIQVFIFPYLFASGLHDDKDIVISNLESVESVGSYTVKQIKRMRIIANLLNEGSEQTQAIVKAFVETVKNTKTVESFQYDDEILEPTQAYAKEATFRVLRENEA